MYPGQWGQPSETQAIRSKQIDTLRQYFPTVKEVLKESLYEVPITLPSRKVITLRISLGRDFPRQPPTLQVYPPVQHRYVDTAHSVVTPAAHDNLGRWQVHANLGKTVYEVVQKLMVEPPTVLPVPGPGSAAPQMPPSPHGPYGPPPASPLPPLPGMPLGPPVPPGAPIPVSTPPTGPAPRAQSRMPDIPASFPELDGKTVAELNSLLNDDAAFQRFFEQLEAVQTIKKIRDDLKASAEELARKNVAKEADIERLRREVAALSQNVSERRVDFDRKAARQQQLAERYSTAGLVSMLADAAAVAEHASDEVAEKFLDGEIDHKVFIKDFMEARKLFHLRSAKKESMTLHLQR